MGCEHQEIRTATPNGGTYASKDSDSSSQPVPLRSKFVYGRGNRISGLEKPVRESSIVERSAECFNESSNAVLKLHELLPGRNLAGIRATLLVTLTKLQMRVQLLDFGKSRQR